MRLVGSGDTTLISSHIEVPRCPRDLGPDDIRGIVASIKLAYHFRVPTRAICNRLWLAAQRLIERIQSRTSTTPQVQLGDATLRQSCERTEGM